ncbi:hypothetical protein Ddye_006901 [Dipteronia dyeriana]|uniref:Uncharacterized protein n=1 Tax=Dipteronia dyeriana TaxID=168575 RepID=A0AAD9XJX6_9ROSI|nr:hypothetical protein Ddye_006901 [Dipteronia dyeriana]
MRANIYIDFYKEKLGVVRLHQTLTNVVIPTFDIKKLPPIIFSTYDGLRTGSKKNEEKYDALKSGKWGLLGWLTAEGSTPLIDVSMQSSSDMTDFHISTVFHALHSERNYLSNEDARDDTLSGDESSVDIATKKNLDSLVRVGEKLLKKPVSKVNFETGVFEPSNEGTNEEALISIAQMLSREKRFRDMRSQVHNMGSSRLQTAKSKA